MYYIMHAASMHSNKWAFEDWSLKYIAVLKQKQEAQGL